MKPTNSAARPVIPARSFWSGCVLSAALAAAVGLAGCQTGGSGPSAQSSDRPMVEVSAADLFSWGPGAASQQLEFYDELERRPIASQDDAVHAMLLLGAGASASTYEGRLAIAKQRGWVDQGFERPGREAVTVGEVSQMLARIMRRANDRSAAGALADFQREGVVPAGAQEYQGLTGAQLLAILSGARDLMEPATMGPSATTTAAAVRPAAGPRDRGPALAAATVGDGETMVSGDSPAPTAAESKPNSKTQRASAKELAIVPLPEDGRIGAVRATAPVAGAPVPAAGPAGTPSLPSAAPTAPAPAPAAKPDPSASKAGRWYTGKPLKKPDSASGS